MARELSMCQDILNSNADLGLIFGRLQITMKLKVKSSYFQLHKDPMTL